MTTARFDEDACESILNEWRQRLREQPAQELPREPEEDPVTIEGRVLLSGTPQQIGIWIARNLGTERCRMTIEWSSRSEGF